MVLASGKAHGFIQQWTVSRPGRRSCYILDNVLPKSSVNRCAPSDDRKWA
jgi:hypothetical protein